MSTFFCIRIAYERVMNHKLNRLGTNRWDRLWTSFITLFGIYSGTMESSILKTALRQSSGLNFPLSLNMYQIMLKRTSITYPICSFSNGSLYGSLHAHKQSFCKNLNLPLNSSEITSLHHYCTIDSYLGMGLNKCQN